MVDQLLRKCKDSWPFQKPVEEWEAPNYYEVIKQPMGMSLKIVHCRCRVGDGDYDGDGDGDNGDGDGDGDGVGVF